LPGGFGAGIQIDHIATTPGGGVQITYTDAGARDYHVLLRRDTLQGTETAVDLKPAGTTLLTDATPTAGRALALYRVAAYGFSEAIDSDHDGIPDAFELQHPSSLDPLNALDALQDPDADARPNLWEYRQHTDPAVADASARQIVARNLGEAYALGADGTLFRMPLYPNPALPSRIGGASATFQTVSAGGGSAAAIDTDGRLWSWGTLAFSPTTDKDWTAVSVGWSHALALKKDGTLWAWGSNPDGRLGLPPGEFGDYSDAAVPTRVGTAHNWVRIAAGIESSVAIASDGTLWRWGRWAVGQSSFLIQSPVQTGPDTDWVGVNGAQVPLLGIKKDGSLWGWALTYQGMPVVDPLTFAPTRVGTRNDWLAVATGSSLVMRFDGTSWSWDIDTQAMVPVINDRIRWTAVTSGAGIDQAGHLALWEPVTTLLWEFLGAPRRVAVPRQVGSDHDWASANHSVGLKADGTAWEWGGNPYFWWDPNVTTGVNLPTPVVTPGRWQQLAMGRYHMLGIKTDGTLWSWGLNSDGQLGYYAGSRPTAPQRVGTASDWSRISGGAFHSIALKKDGSLWGWGRNTSQQAGAGAGVPLVVIPARIGSEVGWTDVSAGGTHSLALKSDGSLWGWGDNSARQLGVAGGGALAEPTRIGTANDWEAIAAGQMFSVAIKSTGILWFFGGGAAPKPAGSYADWKSLSAGYSIALTRKDGTAWTTALPQELDGRTLTDFTESMLQRVDDRNDWAAVSAARWYQFAGVRTDGTLWAWGDNSFGDSGQPVLTLPLPIDSPTVYGWPAP
jgi:alpha-tubulin suppressor-like RCC1 family protein